MALKRKVTEVTGTFTPEHGKQAIDALKARVGANLTWRDVAQDLGDFGHAYLWQVAHGQKPPSRKLLRALGIVKPEKRTGIRVRMSKAEAREIVDRGTVPVNVLNRLRYALWGRK